MFGRGRRRGLGAEDGVRRCRLTGCRAQGPQPVFLESQSRSKPLGTFFQVLLQPPRYLHPRNLPDLRLWSASRVCWALRKHAGEALRRKGLTCLRLRLPHVAELANENSVRAIVDAARIAHIRRTTGLLLARPSRREGVPFVEAAIFILHRIEDASASC